jgi:hypothetical protein
LPPQELERFEEQLAVAEQLDAEAELKLLRSEGWRVKTGREVSSPKHRFS